MSCSRLEISVAKVPAEDLSINLHEIFDQRVRSTFKSLYLEPYEREFDIQSGFDDRAVTPCKGYGADIVRRLKKEEYQSAVTEGTADDLIIDTLDEVLSLKDSTSLIDTLGFFKLIDTDEFFFRIDTVFNVNSKHPLCLLVVPNYEDIGYDFDSKLVITDLDPESSMKACRYKGQKTFTIKGQEKLMTLQFVIVLVLEVIFAQDQLEIEQVAFTVVTNKTMDFYLHGTFQLPLYKEVILYKDMEFLRDINFWEITIMCQRRYQNGEMKKTDGSLIITIGPQELEDIYSQEEDVMLCNSMFIGNNVLPDSAIYTVDNLEQANLTGGKVQSVLPQDYFPQEVKDVVESYISNVLVKNPTEGNQPSAETEGQPKEEEGSKKEEGEAKA